MNTECLKAIISHPLKGRIASEELDELDALAILSSMPSLGPIKIRILLQHFGSAFHALHADPKDLVELPGFGGKISQGWRNWPDAQAWKRNLALVEKSNARLVPFTNPEYPKRLLDIPDHPVLLHIMGELKGADSNSIAVVGTRQASIYGLEMARKISAGLAAMGFTVVSGLARGIDTEAHRGALEKGRTAAVIGSGLADIYPQENRGLAEAIAGQGALISEFPMDTPPDRQNFPQRNRIVSGMALGTVLIEAPLKSGAMITMDKALAQGRKLFALPGRADSEYFRGNHQLIKDGNAHLVENAEDIAAHFEDFFGGLKPKTAPAKPPVFLENEEEELMRLLPDEEINIEEIVQRTKLSIIKLNVLLMSLVLKKAIKEYPGKVYKKVVSRK